MSELRIEAKEVYLEYGAKNESSLRPQDVHITIFDGDDVVAETTLDSLVKKFLLVSAEFAQVLSLLGMTKQKEQSRIVVAKEEQIETVKKQMGDFKTRQDV